MSEFKNRIGKADKIYHCSPFLKYIAWWILKIFQVTKYITYSTIYKRERDWEIRKTQSWQNQKNICAHLKCFQFYGTPHGGLQLKCFCWTKLKNKIDGVWPLRIYSTQNPKPNYNTTFYFYVNKGLATNAAMSPLLPLHPHPFSKLIPNDDDIGWGLDKWGSRQDTPQVPGKSFFSLLFFCLLIYFYFLL